MTSWESLLCGAVGGALPDLMRLLVLRRETASTEFATRGVVWSSLIVSIWLGISTVYSAHVLHVWEGILLGYAAPQFLSKLLSDRNADKQPLSAYRLGIPGVWRIQRWWAL
jgi:transposase InsO family protein